LTRGVNEQVSAAPAHSARDHPVRALPAAGAAVSVTGAKRNVAEQTVPQLMPAGVDVMVPDPLPALLTTTAGRMLTAHESPGGVPLRFTRLPPSVGWRKSVRVPKFEPLVPAVIVSVLDVAPWDSDAGLKIPVSSLDSPLRARLKSPLKSGDRVTVTTTVPL